MGTPYSDLLPRSFWRSGVAACSPYQWRDLYARRFEITAQTPIAAAGSCFAQHIGRRLRQQGFYYLDLEPPPPSLPAARRPEFGYDLFSARCGNVYTARQLLQLARRAFHRFEPEDQIWEQQGRFYDPFRPSIEPDGFASEKELTVLRDQVHLPAVRTMLRSCQVFIFTMGLTEAWVSKADGAVYPVCPGVVAGQFDPSRHEFRNFGFTETYADMCAFIELVRARNPGAKFLLTVSPVPLTATASDQHVLVATSYSKSVLRAVAGALYETYDFVDYFPSYEIVTAHAMRGMLYAPNLRSVTAEGVDHVMSHFFAQHPPPERDPASASAGSATSSDALEAVREASRYARELAEVCDEERLDPVRD